MSRYLSLVLAGVSTLALSTLAAPVGNAVPAGPAELTPAAGTQTSRVGSWCC